jgi:hypothetical protein
LRRGLLVAFLLLVQNKILTGQTETGKGKTDSPSLACAVRTEHKDWRATKPAIVYVEVENLSDTTSEIPLWSHLSLTPVSPSNSLSSLPKDAAVLGASVDPKVFDPLGLPSGAVIRDAKHKGGIRLRFAHHGEKANFKFDARDLTWGFEAANSNPAYKLFRIAEAGAYDLQFHMRWDNGACESAKVRLTILPEKRQK